MWQYNREFRFVSSFFFPHLFHFISFSKTNFKPIYKLIRKSLIFIFYFRIDLEIFHEYINTLYMVEMLFENACASTLRMNLIHLSCNCTSRSHHQTSLNYTYVHAYIWTWKFHINSSETTMLLHVASILSFNIILADTIEMASIPETDKQWVKIIQIIFFPL